MTHPTDSARTALRRATAGHHDRVDAVFSTAMLDDQTSYGRFLTAQAAAHIPVEDALALGGIAALLADWPARVRAQRLRDDLAQIGLDIPSPAGNPVFGGEPALLGAAYVLEGSRLGGAMLRRSVAAGFPVGFLGNVDSLAWRNLLALLDERLDTEVKRRSAIGAACTVFDLFELAGRRHLRVA